MRRKCTIFPLYCIYECVKIALLRPDPAHDADPGSIFYIFMSVIFCFDTGAGKNCGSGTGRNFAPRCGAGGVRKRNFHNGAASQIRHPQRIFYHCNFYFIYALLIYSIIIFSYAPFIYCIYCNVYHMCPRLFAPAHYYSFLTFLKLKSKPIFTVQYFLILGSHRASH
jgi:hypothetical protein